MVKRGQVWARLKGPGGDVRVMAVVEGYVLYRTPGGFPLVFGTEDFVRHFRMVEPKSATVDRTGASK